MRAMRCAALLALLLLVTRVLADDEDPPVSADDLALLAHRLDRRSYLHDPFRLDDRRPGSGARFRPPLPDADPRTRRRAGGRPLLAQTGHDSKGPEAPVVRPAPALGAGAGLVGERLGVRLVPRRQDPRTVGGDGDRELEMGGQGAVLGVDRPAVVAHPDLVAAGVHHRLHGEDHALLQPRAAP